MIFKWLMLNSNVTTGESTSTGIGLTPHRVVMVCVEGESMEGVREELQMLDIDSEVDLQSCVPCRSEIKGFIAFGKIECLLRLGSRFSTS